MADYDGRDPLLEVVEAGAVLRVVHAPLRVGVQVDETGGYDQAGGVDHLVGRSSYASAHLHYPAVLDRHVGFNRLLT
ncbi:hypothetical protein ES703_115266 [subsurface metagenome]